MTLSVVSFNKTCIYSCYMTATMSLKWKIGWQQKGNDTRREKILKDRKKGVTGIKI